MERKKFTSLLFAMAFMEGGVVMACELCGAHMLAPLFGTSVYVWAAVLSITLGGLAVGYWWGGNLALKQKSFLSVSMLLALALVIIMPFTASIVLEAVHAWPLLPGVIIAAIIIIMPPVMGLGLISPQIVQALAVEANNAGNSAGKVYAISTFGGIVFTLCFGFYLIPMWGLRIPVIIAAALAGIIPCIIIWNANKLIIVLFILTIVVALLLEGIQQSKAGVNVLFQKEGVLGQVMVADLTADKENKRLLLVNRVVQSEISLKGQQQPYPDYISKILSQLPQGNKEQVLVLGLGSGALAMELYKKGYGVTACEIDKQVYFAAKNFFNLSDDINVTIDDARHFIETTRHTYKYIIMDVYKGEESPHHLFTYECFEKLKSILKDDGLLMLNVNGYLAGLEGEGMRSVYKTLESAAFSSMAIVATAENEQQRNLLMYAANNSISDEIKRNSIVLPKGNASILTDNRPVLGLLNFEANRRWREAYMQSYTSRFINAGVPIFY